MYLSVCKWKGGGITKPVIGFDKIVSRRINERVIRIISRRIVRVIIKIGPMDNSLHGAV